MQLLKNVLKKNAKKSTLKQKPFLLSSIPPKNWSKKEIFSLVVNEDGFRELLVSSELSVCASDIWAPQGRDDGRYWMIMLGRLDAIKLPGDNHQMTTFMAAEVLLYFMERCLESAREQSAVFRCCCGSFPCCFE